METTTGDRAVSRIPGKRVVSLVQRRRVSSSVTVCWFGRTMGAGRESSCVTVTVVVSRIRGCWVAPYYCLSNPRQASGNGVEQKIIILENNVICRTSRASKSMLSKRISEEPCSAGVWTSKASVRRVANVWCVCVCDGESEWWLLKKQDGTEQRVDVAGRRGTDCQKKTGERQMIGMHGSNAPSPQPDRMQVDSTTTALAMPWLGQQSGGRRPITTSGGTVPGSAPRDPVWRLW